MARNIIYVDGSVGVGKTTFINILESCFKTTLREMEGNRKRQYCYNVEVLPEPLHRDWTQKIVDGLGDYRQLLNFLHVRKQVAIENWSRKIAADGLQELEHNVLIVERSPDGDSVVREGNTDYKDDVIYTGERVQYILLVNDKVSNDEQDRLRKVYHELRRDEVAVVLERPSSIVGYFEYAQIVVRSILGV